MRATVGLGITGCCGMTVTHLTVDSQCEMFTSLMKLILDNDGYNDYNISRTSNIKGTLDVSIFLAVTIPQFSEVNDNSNA